MFFDLLVPAQGPFLGVRPQTLFTAIDLWLFWHSVWNELLPELLSAVLVTLAEVPEELDPEFKLLSAVGASILGLRVLFSVFLKRIQMVVSSVLYNNHCSVHVFDRRY